ncbi:AMP-dependent synthetase [Fusobacterium necrophorum]|uniref:AMP-binding protein n=1 Tax=Fusobacterium necrophorum TaxID=859 RepID=UPI000887FFB6|nr:AMP-binding protein [Fusobacterium necrophorum]AYZ74225.1 AMP-dependent synthetase [Fusobacterium necrophorum]AZW09893.1 AMP-dependent synthetase [Fusobacterium necrophorum subsp. necrophorum]SDB02534.1 Acyl-CoA synthetase (AMP-forming)/AMP-acid ligase II [Fusobacterium necrophorum]SQD08624.1 Polyketide synthase PksJ [Fusobacterium necrophorum subsp. necrophorum]
MDKLSYKTLNEGFLDFNQSHIFIEYLGNEITITSNEFKDSVKIILYNLKKLGIKRGDEVLFQIDNSIELLKLFWACILGGFIAIPYTYLEKRDEKNKILKIWEILENPYLVSNTSTIEILDTDDKFRHIVRKSISIDKLENPVGFIDVNIDIPNENDIAFIQYSSGSTSDPKGVIVTHKNIISSINATIRAMDVVENDIYLSWLPLTHSFGMIGTYLTPLLAGCSFYIMSPKVFVLQPLLWLEKMDEHKVTVTASPNFGIRHVCNYIDIKDDIDINLKSLRLIIDGAEPVSALVCRLFIEKMKKFGMSSSTLKPSYGLSEGTLVVSTSSKDKEFVEVIVKRESLNIGDKVIKCNKMSKNTIAFVEVGACLDNLETKIVDDSGRILEKGKVGTLFIKGDSVSIGYYRDQKSTIESFDKDGWLNTGDLGFFNGNKLVLTGRKNDVVFVNGENYYFHDIENICNELSSLGFSKVAICGVYNSEIDKEKIFCFVECNKGEQEFSEIAKKLKKYAINKIGIGIEHFIKIENIPVTISGKIKRFELKKYLVDNFGGQ